jgi:hypothetical protein
MSSLIFNITNICSWRRSKWISVETGSPNGVGSLWNSVLAWGMHSSKTLQWPPGFHESDARILLQSAKGEFEIPSFLLVWFQSDKCRLAVSHPHAQSGSGTRFSIQGMALIEMWRPQVSTYHKLTVLLSSSYNRNSDDLIPLRNIY